MRIHDTNLEYITKKYPNYVSRTMEEIHPYINPPWWSLTNTTTHITNTPKDKAKEEHENFLKEHNTPNNLHIYMDGSGIANCIGAYCPTISATAHLYLGKADTANVYMAELAAIHLGIKMAGKSNVQFNKMSIYVDNQSSIQAIVKPKQHSRQYIVRNILHDLEELQHQRPNLEFRIAWVPGHMDITGNEKADEEAKKAAQEQHIVIEVPCTSIMSIQK